MTPLTTLWDNTPLTTLTPNPFDHPVGQHCGDSFELIPRAHAEEMSSPLACSHVSFLLVATLTKPPLSTIAKLTVQRMTRSPLWGCRAREYSYLQCLQWEREVQKLDLIVLPLGLDVS
jgi:hypothetical protein